MAVATPNATRELEDDVKVNFRMSGGTVGRLWTSKVAIGRQHGFEIQNFGETGGMKWHAEHPNQLIYTPLGGRTQIIEKGEGGLHEDAQRLSRVAIAHSQLFLWPWPISAAIWQTQSGARRATACLARLTACAP